MPPVTISGTQNELSLASFGPFFRGNMGIDAGIEEFGGRHADLMACSCQFVEGSIFGREWKPCWDSFTWFRKPEFLQCAYQARKLGFNRGLNKFLVRRTLAATKLPETGP